MFVCVKLPEVELLDKVYKAVCSNFARVGGWGGGELGVFKKEGGRSCKQCQEGELGDNIKKKIVWMKLSRSHLPLLLQRMADWEKIWGKGLSEVSVGEIRRLEG